MDARFIQSEIRQKLIEALRIDLIGPRMGADEVLEENPELSYLTGALHTTDSKNIKDIIEFDVQEDIELDSGDSDSLGDEDNEDKYSSKFKQQSSLGLSFYLPDNVNVFDVRLEWGDYIIEKQEYEDKNGKTKNRKVYTRLPRIENIQVEFNDGERSKEYQAGETDEGIMIKASCFKLKTGYKQFSVYAANYRKAKDETVNGIMFQTQLCVTPKDGGFFVPEYLCRRELEDEYFYESRPIYGRGHGCAADWQTDENGKSIKIISEFIPEHEIPNISPNLDGFDKSFFSIKEFSFAKKKNETISRLYTLHSAYVKWIDGLRNNPKMGNSGFAANQGADVIEKCREQAGRILAGINILETNPKAYKAFCFMNHCMFIQRCINEFSKKYGSGIQCNIDEYRRKDRSEWRAFQIAFILLNLPGLVDTGDKYRQYVDLLYFPTGGGKTEAYLGLMAFLLGYRRITSHSETDSDYNKDGGVTVILRYTLRLLTTQQRDRLTKMIISAEIIRREYLPNGAPFGTAPFSVGFYVGSGVTPNRFSDFKDTDGDPYNFKNKINQLNKQLATCPYCGKPLKSDDFYVDLEQESIDIYCSDENCYFFKYKDNRIAIPVYLIDEQIYRKCPSVIIATVDKFARLPWDVACNAIFGRVDRFCPRHGYIAIGQEHADRHNSTKNGLPATSITDIKPFYPPELIVQDELHLITGPLGTIYGAYEAAIEELCSVTKNGVKILPKYVVSTATIRNAEEQVRCLYGRTQTETFPPGGFDIRDSFFTREVPVTVSPFRKYCGISANGKSVKTTLLRVYAILIQTALHLAEQAEYKDYIDPYYTLIGYFNSIRELGGTVRLLQDDIPKRQKWIKKHYRHNKQRFFEYKEVTSRMTSGKIAGLLKELEGTIANKESLEKKSKNFLDVAIATNMISVGLDIDRLGLMCVLGQPKQSSEYIQTTSRIGRSYPGLVVTVYNPYRPRDLSHYENFKGYHSQIYRYVEGTSATPFSARARDRVLHALFISLARLQIVSLSENAAASAIDTIPKEEIDNIVNKIAARVAKVAPKLRADVIGEITEFIDTWKTCRQVSPLPLYYYIANTKNGARLLNYYGELCKRTEKPTLTSMREVENASTLYYYREE